MSGPFIKLARNVLVLKINSKFVQIRSRLKLKTRAAASVVDPKLFFSDPDPDPTFQEISDPDPDSDPDAISDPT